MRKIAFLSLILLVATTQMVIAQGGANCSQAAIAKQGINISDNSLGDQWFEYTAKSNGKITISSCGTTEANTFVEVYDGCDLEAFSFSDDFSGKQSEISFEVISGFTYYINWRNFYTNQDYEWNLTESQSLQGEFCSNPLLVSTGYTVSNAPQNKYRWFEFTATRKGKVTISAVGKNASLCRVAVFDDCSFTSSINNDQSWNPSKIAFDAVEGANYLICWQNGDSNGTIEWTVEESNWKTGERCIDPIDIDISLNNPIDHESATNKWYRYIARKDGEITISSVAQTSEDTYLEVYKGCGEQRVMFNDDVDGLQSEITMNVSAGNVYLIKWDKIFTPKPYSWSLKSDMISTDMPEDEKNDLNIYPNPTTGYVNVDLTSFDTNTVVVKVMTIDGAVVKNFQLSGGIIADFDISELVTGVYQIVFEDLVSQKVVRLLKQ